MSSLQRSREMSSYIQFQVWRPSGCYSLVGLNEPPDRGLLTPAESCVSLSVSQELVRNSRFRCSFVAIVAHAPISAWGFSR